MLANQEILNLIKAMGVGIEEQFDMEGLRYERIVIMTDADVDGAHIMTLANDFIFQAHAADSRRRPLIYC
jgi:DNA gyrase subunit B